MLVQVAMYVDPAGTTNRSPEGEYDVIEAYLRRILPDAEFTFKRGLPPSSLGLELRCDLYVFDVGGLCAEGCDIKQQYRPLMQAIVERPSTLFVLWTVFTTRYYWGLVDVDYPKLREAANVLMPPLDSTEPVGSVLDYYVADIKDWCTPRPPKPAPAPPKDEAEELWNYLEE